MQCYWYRFRDWHFTLQVFATSALLRSSYSESNPKTPASPSTSLNIFPYCRSNAYFTLMLEPLFVIRARWQALPKSNADFFLAQIGRR
jgi:hypothetical protein